MGRHRINATAHNPNIHELAKPQGLVAEVKSISVLTLLVSLQALLQWLVIVALIIPIGYFFARHIDKQAVILDARSAWLGFGFLVAYINLVQIFVRLNSPFVVCGIVLFSLCALFVHRNAMLLEVKNSLKSIARHPKIFCVSVIFLLFLANLTLSFVGNYDSALYHLPLIDYLANHPIIPGLANLHSRFGFSSSTYVVGAFFQSGPWHAEGYRLVNGFILVLLLIEFSKCVRLVQSNKFRPGDVLIVLATPLILALAITDPWQYISSPSPDLSAAILLLVAFAYSLNAFSSLSAQDISFALILSTLSATFRPLNLFLLGVIGLVSVFIFFRDRASRKIVFAAMIPSSLLFATYVIRNFIITGYFLYPSSIAITHPEWQLPIQVAQGDVAGIGNWARGMHTFSDWDWFMPWLRDNKIDFYPIALLLLATIFSVGLKLLPTRISSKSTYRCLLLGSIAIGGTLVIWFVGAPTPRFAWGVLYAFAVFPLAILSSLGSQASDVRQKSLILGILVLLLAQVAWVPTQRGTKMFYPSVQHSPHGLMPMTTIPFHQVETKSGLILNVPDGSDKDQCYRAPMCTPYPNLNLYEISLFGRTGYSVK